MFLRISISSKYEHILSDINALLDTYNFEHVLECESYRESKLKHPGETWVIGDCKKADITLVVNIGNRDEEEMINWILVCLDKKNTN